MTYRSVKTSNHLNTSEALQLLTFVSVTPRSFDRGVLRNFSISYIFVLEYTMTNLEFCCNPFKQRNHNPEPWRVLPVTKSLREQFRLYLGDDTDICITCKRQLYSTLPNFNNEKPLHSDSISEEIEETFSWNDDVEIDTESDGACDYLLREKHYLGYQLAKEKQADLRSAQQQSIKQEDISKTEVVSE